MATVFDWVLMCAETPEFVAQYNRLFGASINFSAPRRTPIEAMVDRACGHEPAPVNDEADMHEFVAYCIDLWCRMPEVKAAAARMGA